MSNMLCLDSKMKSPLANLKVSKVGDSIFEWFEVLAMTDDTTAGLESMGTYGIRGHLIFHWGNDACGHTLRGACCSELLNNYTLIMDVKIDKPPTGNGLSLYQSAWPTPHYTDECYISPKLGVGLDENFGEGDAVTCGKWTRIGIPCVTPLCGVRSTHARDDNRCSLCDATLWCAHACTVGSRAGWVLQLDTSQLTPRFSRAV